MKVQVVAWSNPKFFNTAAGGLITGNTDETPMEALKDSALVELKNFLHKEVDRIGKKHTTFEVKQCE